MASLEEMRRMNLIDCKKQLKAAVKNAGSAMGALDVALRDVIACMGRQREAAEKLNLSSQNLSSYFTGQRKPSAEWMMKAAWRLLDE